MTYENAQQIQEIIDGQQRITTSSIFLAVVRDIANKIYLNNKESIPPETGDKLRDIRRQAKKCLRGVNDERPSLVVQEKSKLDGHLQSFFMSLIHKDIKEYRTVESELVSKKNGVIHNMGNAYSLLANAINKQLKAVNTISKQADYLERLFSIFLDQFYIVMISAPSQQDAFIIFETLNSRGQDLKASDIIKNHLMYLLQDNMENANQEWEKINQRLGLKSDRITRFIRTYWASRKRLVAESALYRSLSQDISDENSANKFLDELLNLVDVYDVLESPTQPRANWNYFKNVKLRQIIDIMSRIHVIVYYPIVLALYYRKFNESDILKVLNKVLSIFVRHRMIMNEGTNRLETGFADIAKQIWSGSFGTIDAILNEMNNKLLKSNEDVLASFSNLKKPGGQRGAKRWTLEYLLEILFQEEESTELYESVFDQDLYRLIHIQKVNISDEYYDRLGNWTLLEKTIKYNDDGEISDRLASLNRSDLSMNKDLANEIRCKGWSDECIDERQQEMGKTAIYAW